MAKPANISETERNLFRRSVGTVDRIKHDQVMFDMPKPPPVPAQSQAEDRAVIREMATLTFSDEDVEIGDELLFKRPGIQQQVMRKLRRGQFAIERVLDLHGMTVKPAKAALIQFLEECQRANCRCVRIIHGKGYGSKNGQPVLKNNLNQWLQTRHEVLAFSSARPADGGTGAVYVLIKRHK